MFLVSVPRIFKIAGRAYVVDSRFSKMTRQISPFYISVENSIILSLLVISKGPLLTGVAWLQSTCCNVTKNELLTKFLTDVLNVSENVQEELCNGVPF